MARLAAVIRPDWPAPERVRAVATTRAGGVSVGAFASLNLAEHVGDDPACVRENRARLRRDLALPAELLWLRQVHGATVADARRDEGGVAADAMIAGAPGQVCALLTADCLPVLFCDERASHVAAAHAGWRGLAAGVLEATVAALLRRGVPPERLLVWIGPAISAAAYEVGAEVREQFLCGDPRAADAFSANPRGRWQLDLVGLARSRLAAAGIGRVFGGELCTYADPDRFFSHRRDGPCGRQATLIWLE